MNAVLVITVLCLVVGEIPAIFFAPCRESAPNNAFNLFVYNHVLRAPFDTKSKTRWERYLTNLNLCIGPRRAFVSRRDQRHFVEICNGFGMRQDGNHCTSTRFVWLYDLRIRRTRRGCVVTNLIHVPRIVTVACDKVNDLCRPTHLDRLETNSPSRRAPRC